MAEIDILLAAYNGERFIAEQIDSLLAQTFQDFRILIRDDGSADNTPEIIEEYAQKYPDKIEFVHDDIVCQTPTKNFMELLKYARADYVMFCDQDDYWLPYKVQITLDYMKKTERENPGEAVLVFTGLEVADAELKSFDRFMALGLPQARFGLTQLLLANCISGCTEMCNRTLYANILTGGGDYSERMNMYDHWIALYAACCGVICRVPMALIMYRQHENNLLGAGALNVYKHNKNLVRPISKLFRILSKLKLLMNPKKVLQRLSRSKRGLYEPGETFKFFRSRYAHLMKPDKLLELDNFLKLWGDNKRWRLAVFFKTGYPYTTRFRDKVRVFFRLLLY